MTLRQFRHKMTGCKVLAVCKATGKAGYAPLQHVYESICRHSSDPKAVVVAMTDPNLLDCAFEDDYARYYVNNAKTPDWDAMVEAQQYKEAGL